jgi:hypothetical protein
LCVGVGTVGSCKDENEFDEDEDDGDDDYEHDDGEGGYNVGSAGHSEAVVAAVGDLSGEVEASGGTKKRKKSARKSGGSSYYAGFVLFIVVKYIVFFNMCPLGVDLVGKRVLIMGQLFSHLQCRTYLSIKYRFVIMMMRVRLQFLR